MQMSEAEIRQKYITPALASQWERQKIAEEKQITGGRIELIGSKGVRRPPKRADYLLYTSANHPLAVVEAKDNKHTISYGLQQAMTYAQMLDLPFAYSSNGDGFAEHDFLTGQEREFRLDEFPSEAELLARLQASGPSGACLTSAQARALSQPYYSGINAFPPRYYQRIAINRTVEAIVRGQKRLLLVMATGTGKTYTAFQIVYRLLQSGFIRRVLYLADRNVLVDQSIAQDFAPLEKVIHKIDVSRDESCTISAYQVYFSLYQQLAGDNGQDRFSELFAPNFFDLVIVDECHRGSAKEESRWRRILEYFSSAAQIGMTATPKETKYISNVSYFGDPIYTYSLKEGIDDGFLAPFKVISVTSSIGDGWRPYKGQLDKLGRPIEDRVYTNSDYDYRIIIEDRTQQVAQAITKFLRNTDRMSKTIVFCPTEEAAERMRQALVNLNADLVKEHPDYVVRITGSDVYGRSKLSYFISVSSPFPVIATTSKLLSTGVDCKMTKLIVLDSMIGSMTEFKQIIGRGTRLREKEGKTHFTVMDFRGVTRLFADPDWDGPIEISPDFTASLIRGGSDNNSDPDANPEPQYKPIVDKDGCRVEIVRETVSIYTAEGKLLRQEALFAYAQETLRAIWESRDVFASFWRDHLPGAAVREQLLEHGLDVEALKSERGLTDLDDFDFICHLAYGVLPLTRLQRAEMVRQRGFLESYQGSARAVLEALLDKYAVSGIYEIGQSEILKLDPFRPYGKPAKIASYFGGKDGYLQALHALQTELYREDKG